MIEKQIKESGEEFIYFIKFPPTQKIIAIKNKKGEEKDLMLLLEFEKINK